MNSLQNLVPLSSRELWDQVNDSLKENFFGSHQGVVRAYSSVAQALIEIPQGTSQFLSHKKNVSIFYGANPYFEILTPQFIRDDIQVQKLKVTDLPKNLESAKKWVAQLPKETVYVLYPEDHIVTGEIYPWTFLDEALNEKRIFSFRISHHCHFQNQNQNETRPFSVRICIFDIENIVALCGTRFKTPPGSVVWMNWNLNFCELIKAKQNRTILEKEVENFENQLSQFKFLKTSERVYDRAVLHFSEINVDRIISEFPELMASTTNLCSWNSFGINQCWWWPEQSPEILRGLIIIPAEKILKFEPSAKIKLFYQKCISEQKWTIS